MPLGRWRRSARSPPRSPNTRWSSPTSTGTIGDGDHGENLARGFTAVLTKLDAGEPAERRARC